MTTNNAPNEGGEDLCQALLLLTLSPRQWWALPDQLTLNWLESQALIDRQPQRMRCREYRRLHDYCDSMICNLKIEEYVR